MKREIIIFSLGWIAITVASFIVGWEIGGKRAVEKIRPDVKDLIEKEQILEDEAAMAYDCTVFSVDERNNAINMSKKEEVSSPVRSMPPRMEIITPDEIGEDPDYGIQELIFYTDHILANSMDETVDDPHSLLGYSALNYLEKMDPEFGETMCLVDRNNHRYLEIYLESCSYTEHMAQCGANSE